MPGVSLELCGGTHLRHTGEAGLFRIVKEAGVASGVRRIEADELRRSGGGAEEVVAEADVPLGDGGSARFRGVRVRVRDADDARSMGDAFREGEAGGVLALAAETPDGKVALFVFVTDDLVSKGVRAGDLVREIAAVAGGRGGGRPHMAQGGIEEVEKVGEALAAGPAILAARAGAGASA
jgi:alanyl-tRNA synthetase